MKFHKLPSEIKREPAKDIYPIMMVEGILYQDATRKRKKDKGNEVVIVPE